MKKLKSDLKSGNITIQVEHTDDLWYLKSILAPGDLLKGRTLRKIGGSSGDQRAKQATRKPVTLQIKLEKIEFSPNSPTLRALGVVTQGPEDVPLGTHHTFSLEQHTQITIHKDQWLSFQLDKITEACKSNNKAIIVAVHDREEAYIALLKKYGYDLLSTIAGNVQKKGDDAVTKGDLYTQLGQTLQQYVTRYKADHVIVASPAFFKEDFLKTVGDELKKKIITATCSSVSENAISEVIKRPEVKQALEQERYAKELSQVEEFFKQLSTSGLVCYGHKDVKTAGDAGAIKTLLVADKLLYTAQEQGTFEQLDRLMKSVDSAKGEVTIISTDHESGERLMGIGGIGAILRYKVA